MELRFAATMEDRSKEDVDFDEAEENVLLDLDWKDSEISLLRNRTLIGRLVAERMVNKNTVKTMIHKAWSLQKGLSIVEVNGYTFKFCFEHVEDCERVLRGRPWLILGFLLIVERWHVM